MNTSLSFTVLALLVISPLLAQASPPHAAPGSAIGSPIVQQPTRPSMPDRDMELPQPARSAILKDMAGRLVIPTAQLRITEIEADTFDGCMSIAPLDATCTLIGLFGWRVTVQGGQHRWTYHVLQNQKFQLNGFVSVPRSVTQAALQAAARHSRIPVSRLQVNWVEQKTWTNSCLGLPLGGRACRLMNIPGWIVTITDGQQNWVYHTDSTRTVYLNQAINQP